MEPLIEAAKDEYLECKIGELIALLALPRQAQHQNRKSLSRTHPPALGDLLHCSINQGQCTHNFGNPPTPRRVGDNLRAFAASQLEEER